MAQGEDGTLRSVCQYELNIDRLNVADGSSACSIHGINTRPAENVETPDARLRARLFSASRGAVSRGCLTALGGHGQAKRSRRANPGTDSQFPANCAGNLVSVPGLRRIAARLPQSR